MHGWRRQWHSYIIVRARKKRRKCHFFQTKGPRRDLWKKAPLPAFLRRKCSPRFSHFFPPSYRIFPFPRSNLEAEEKEEEETGRWYLDYAKEWNGGRALGVQKSFLKKNQSKKVFRTNIISTKKDIFHISVGNMLNSVHLSTHIFWRGSCWGGEEARSSFFRTRFRTTKIGPDFAFSFLKKKCF